MRSFSPLKVLAIESYYGGSHKAFLDSWIEHSRHDWRILSLPAANWKSRLRHSAYHFASQIKQLSNPVDILFCSDLINLAELKALAAPTLDTIPSVLYFHENQFSYPVQPPNRIDEHLAFHNLTAAATANQVWWNSSFNRQAFLQNSAAYVDRYPDYDFHYFLAKCEANSYVFPPGVDVEPPPQRRSDTPTLCWAARWENDKSPHTFFKALKILLAEKLDFRVNVLGEQGEYIPDCFDDAQRTLGSRIQRWGYQPSRNAYLEGLAESDFFVSTAAHEFFGISVCEAVLCGAYPVLPKRLAYPEVLQLSQHPERTEHFYSGGAPALAQHLKQLLLRRQQGNLWLTPQSALQASFEQYQMKACAPAMDQQLEDLAMSPS